MLPRIDLIRHGEIEWSLSGQHTGRTDIPLTALAVIVGAAVILAGPIFQGLAISLMAGEIASVLINRMAVPVLCFMVNAHKAAVPAALMERRTPDLPQPDPGKQNA